MTYHDFVMRMNALIIVPLLMIVIAAPLVDAIACDDCSDVIALRDVRQRLTNGAEHYYGNPSSSEAGGAASRETGDAQDLCPVCANIAAAMGNTCCGAPSMISHTNHLPKLFALSDPSYFITKPPQN